MKTVSLPASLRVTVSLSLNEYNLYSEQRRKRELRLNEISTHPPDHGVKVSPLKVTPLIRVTSSSTPRSQCHIFQLKHCTHSSSPKAYLRNLPSAGHPINIC